MNLTTNQDGSVECRQRSIQSILGVPPPADSGKAQASAATSKDLRSRLATASHMAEKLQKTPRDELKPTAGGPLTTPPSALANANQFVEPAPRQGHPHTSKRASPIRRNNTHVSHLTMNKKLSTMGKLYCINKGHEHYIQRMFVRPKKKTLKEAQSRNTQM